MSSLVQQPDASEVGARLGVSTKLKMFVRDALRGYHDVHLMRWPVIENEGWMGGGLCGSPLGVVVGCGSETGRSFGGGVRVGRLVRVALLEGLRGKGWRGCFWHFIIMCI